MTAPILVVAIADSVHTQRWLDLLRGGKRRAVLLPSTHGMPGPGEADLVPIASAADLERLPPGGIGLWVAPRGPEEEPADDLPPPIGWSSRLGLARGATVARAVRALRPAIVHSMEVQTAGYACLAAARALGADFPRWLVSNWGSDFFLYEKLAAHRPILAELARRMDGCIVECGRDVALLRSLGFGGDLIRVIPASGGADFTHLPALQDLPPPSARRTILVKGYHGWSGRGQHVLSALHLAARHLSGYRIGIVLATHAVAHAGALLAQADGLDVAVEPWLADHRSAVQRLAGARLMLGSGISDGIGTTLLEAMAVGCFPIVANTSCANEWLLHGRHGFICDPHDVGAMAEAIATAATNDALVDAAAPRNRAEVERRWDAATNRHAAEEAYAALAPLPEVPA